MSATRARGTARAFGELRRWKRRWADGRRCRPRGESSRDGRAAMSEDGGNVACDERPGDEAAERAERKLIAHPIMDHRPAAPGLELVDVAPGAIGSAGLRVDEAGVWLPRLDAALPPH